MSFTVADDATAVDRVAADCVVHFGSDRPEGIADVWEDEGSGAWMSSKARCDRGKMWFDGFCGVAD
jgi:hypothetical protein